MPLLYVFTLLVGFEFMVVHALAEYFDLYWRFMWLDLGVHLLGGVLVTLVFYTLARMVGYNYDRFSLPAVIGFALIPMLAWEGFGVYRYSGFKPGFVGDSTLDLLFGILGVVLGYYLARALIRL
jgi:glycopeptide antibiotics resistance protein